MKAENNPQLQDNFPSIVFYNRHKGGFLMCTHHSPQHYTNKKYLSMQRPLLILTAKLISDTECLLHGFSSPLKESPDAILTAVV